MDVTCAYKSRLAARVLGLQGPDISNIESEIEPYLPMYKNAGFIKKLGSLPKYNHFVLARCPTHTFPPKKCTKTRP